MNSQNKKILIAVSEYPPYGSGIANAAYNLNKMLEDLGYETYTIHPRNLPQKNILYLFRKFGFIYLFLFWQSVIWYLRYNKDKYDLLFFHQPFFFNKLNINKKVIVYFHVTYYGKWLAFYNAQNNNFSKYYYKLISIFEKKSLNSLISENNNNFLIISDSNSVAKEIKRIVPQVKINIIPFYVKHNFKIEHKINNLNELKIIWVGRLIDIKNPEYALNLIYGLINDGIKIRFTMIGDGNYYKKINKIIKNNSSSKIYYFKKIPHSRMFDMLKQNDIILSTSLYEGLPLGLLEGIDAGLIPIVTNIPSLKEIINELNLGGIIPLNNIIESKAMIKMYLRNKYLIDKENIKNIQFTKYYHSIILSKFKNILSS